MITGRGRYVSDWNLDGQLYAHFLRSDRAHARIASIDVSAALAHPGVVTVLTGDDVAAAGLQSLVAAVGYKGRGGSDLAKAPRPALAQGRVRFVGDAVAMVVADSALAAQDASELIVVDYEDLPVVVKALQLAASNGVEMSHNSWDGSYTMTTRMAAQRAYAEAGIKDPLKELSMTEVHDCFSITELVVMEDLGLSKEGQGYKDILNGKYDADGEVPCQIDGGLKCFGHPIGASGLRMAYEVYTQINGRAGSRQLKDPVMGLTHNLGGIPNRNVCSVSILGRLNQ